MKQIWQQEGDLFFHRNESSNHDKLPVGVYEAVSIPFMGMACRHLYDSFTFQYKIYGLETEFIERSVSTYHKTSKNLGILLNGIKGTGKTVTSKIIANTLNLPVIIINSSEKEEGSNSYIEQFINEIPQDVVIFIDEYEKLYDESSSLLSIMDGAQNSEYRRVFILTTNSLSINTNLLDRPSRIRYLKTFDNLEAKVVEEIIDDLLINKSFKSDSIDFISSLEYITVDIVKSVLEEINIHNQTPSKFKDFFNVRKLSGKFNVYEIIGDKRKIVFESVKIHPGINYYKNDNALNSTFYADQQDLGVITEIMAKDIIKVKTKGTKVKKSTEKIYMFEPADIMNNSYRFSSVQYGF